MTRSQTTSLAGIDGKVWLVDPVSYTGMSYYDHGLTTSLAELGVDVTLLGSDRWMLERFADVQRHLRPFRGTSRGGRVRRGVAYAVSLIRILLMASRMRPAIVHWQYIEIAPLDLFTMRLLRSLGVRVVYTAHEITPWRRWPGNDRLMRAVYGSADRVIVHNEQDVDALAGRYGVDRRKMCVTGHGDYGYFATPGLSRQAARQALGLDVEAPIALFFGSLRRSKGLLTLLAAWVEVRQKLPNAVLVIAAGGGDRGALPDDLPDGIELRIGRLDADEANRYYRAADLLVLPYHEITTSGVLRYAYSSARAVLATSVGEHTQWVLPGITGDLVPPRDAGALAGALTEMLPRRRKLDEMGRRGLMLSDEAFRWSSIAKRTVDCYRAALRRGVALL